MTQQNTIATPVFGVGCAKSGTHSLASMFEKSLRAAHEPAVEHLMRLVLSRRAGDISERQFAPLISQLFDALNLDLNVSQINGFIITTLYSVFPKARYILTLRDNRSWLKSFVNYQVVMEPIAADSAWYKYRNLRFRPLQFPHKREDAPLKAKRLYSLDAYLAHWLRHNLQVINTVPAGQLLVIPMRQLASEASRIAEFMGLPASAADLTKAHDHPGLYDSASPLDELDRAYLEERLDFYNRKLLEAVKVPPETMTILKAAIGAGVEGASEGI